MLALTANLAGSQPVTRLWLKTTSLASSDSYKALVQDSAGNSIVCGVSVLGNGKDALLVAKFDSLGNKKWEKVLPSDTGHTGAKALAVDGSGNIVVVGYGRTILSSKRQSRIVRISAGGTVLWDSHGKATGGSEWNDVAVDTNGEITATGYFNDGTQSIMRTSHYLISGTLAWSRDYVYPGLTGDHQGLHVVLDANNDAYVAGVHDAGQYVFNTLVKYNQTSSQIWMKHVDGPIKARPRGLELRFGTNPVMMCDIQHSIGHAQPYRVEAFEYSPSGVYLDNHPMFPTSGARLETVQFDVNPLGELFAGGIALNSSNQLAASYISIHLGNFGTAGTDSQDRDLRAFCGGLGTREFYYSTVATGSGSRPSTIYAHRWASSGIGPREMWNSKIYGSTATTATPYAELTYLTCDARGDIFAIGHFSGATSQDAFLAKYETGPIAQDATQQVMDGQVFTSVDNGYLESCGQVSQAAFILVQDALHGSFSHNPDGTYTYDSDPNFVGIDSVRYRMERSNSSVVRSAEAKIDFYVYSPIVTAVANPMTLHSDQMTTVTITLEKNAVTALPLGMTRSASLSLVQNPVVPAGSNIAVAKLRVGAIASSGTATILIRSGTSSKTLTIALEP